MRFGIGLRYEYYDYDKFLYQEGSTTQQYSTDNEHFFSYFAQMEYETFDKAYFPSRGISARASYSLYTDNFTQYNDHAPFSAIKGYCEGVITADQSFLDSSFRIRTLSHWKGNPLLQIECHGWRCSVTLPATAVAFCGNK